MNTFRYIALRLLQAVPVLLGVSIVTFALMAATPGDPIRLLVGVRASDETIALLRDRYGLEDPILSQYFPIFAIWRRAIWDRRCVTACR